MDSAANEGRVDFTFLNEFSKGDPARMATIIKAFLASGPDEMGRLSQAGEDMNWEEARKLAHALKPKLQYAGLAEVSHAMATIEKMIDQEQVADVAGLIVWAAGELEECIPEINQELDRLQSQPS